MREFWETNYCQDVIVFFRQKYDSDKEWEWHEELVEWNGHYSTPDMTFHNDFYEGQNCVQIVAVVPLHEVTAYYAEHQLPHNGEKG